MTQAAAEEGCLRGAGHVSLCYRWTPAVEPRAVLVFVHGLAEHFGRLSRVVANLVPRGFSCLTFDLRGHGRSGGTRHHVPRFAMYLDDLDAILAGADQLSAGTAPRFLVGHSLGGLIVASHALERRPSPAGIVLVSPAMGFAGRPGRWPLLAGRILNVLLPGFPMASHLPLDRVSRNPDVERMLRAENPRGVRVSPRWYFECRSAQARAIARADALGVPMLTLAAGRDAIVDPAAAHTFHFAAAAQPEDFVRYDGCFHALFDESERDDVLDRLGGWVESVGGR